MIWEFFYSPKWNRARHFWRVTFFLTRHQILYFTDDRSIFFSLKTLASTYSRMKLKKSGIPQKNLDKNDDFVYSTPLFCCSFFFWIRRLKSSMFLVLFFFLNKAIKVDRGVQFRGKKNQYSILMIEVLAKISSILYCI